MVRADLDRGGHLLSRLGIDDQTVQTVGSRCRRGVVFVVAVCVGRVQIDIVTIGRDAAFAEQSGELDLCRTQTDAQRQRRGSREFRR